MKVLYFSPGLNPHDQRFLTALASSGHEIHFLHEAATSFTALAAGITQHQFKLTDGCIPSDLDELVPQFKNLVEQIEPDIVHAGPLHNAAWIAAHADCPNLVSMSWAADILYWFEKDEDTRLKILETLEKSTALVGDCEAVASKAITLGFPCERITLFPWGVDLEHFQPSGSFKLRDALGWTDQFVLLCNRSMEPIYGVDLVVEGFIKASRQNPSIRLLLFGKGSMETQIREAVRDSGLQDRVHFGGFASLAELPDVYRSADVFVTASHCDGSSVSLMEALACGRPVIASAIPGNLEWIQEGSTGWIFQDGDANQLSEKIIAASCSQDIKKIGANGRCLAESKSDWKVNFPVLLDAYRGVQSRGEKA